MPIPNTPIHYLINTPINHNYKYIFLDLDDTIWDFHANAKEALRDVFFRERLNEHFEDFENFYQDYSKRNLELWTQYGQGLISKDYLIVERFLHLLKKVGKDDENLALKMNRDFLDTLAEKTILVPYALELMDFCKSGNLPMTILSNGFTEVQYRKLRNSKIEHYFSHVVLSEAAGGLKPDPAIFEYALKLNDATVDETLMIGDSYEADIVGAVHSGIDALFLNNSTKKYEMPAGVVEIKSLKDAVALLGG